MSKKLIQDIVIKRGGSNFFNRSVQRKALIQEVEKEPIIKVHTEGKPKRRHTTHHILHESNQISKNSKILLWTICIASVATLLFLLLSVFSSATVTVTPKKQPIVLNDTYNISTNKDFEGLHFQVINLKRNLSKSIASDTEENVERKATGKATLYNNFSSSNQRLINNTRLESLDGLIYRIRQSVDIPGIKTVNGVKTPGSMEVDIIADQPGDKYNMNLSDFKGDFKIPGFKDSSKYNSFYGRLSSDITGGYIGMVKSVSDQVLASTRQELKNSLREGLIKDIFLQKPDQYYIFKDNYFIQYTDLPDTSGDKDYQVSEDATIYAIVFDKNELSAFIAKNKIKDFDGSKVDVLWNDNIQAIVTGTMAKPWTESSLKVKLVGNANVVWSYDREEILSEILGKKKSILADIKIKNKDSISDITANISPRWKSSFPDNAKKIKFIDSVRGVVAR